MRNFFAFVIGSISLFGAIGWDIASTFLIEEDMKYYFNFGRPNYPSNDCDELEVL